MVQDFVTRSVGQLVVQWAANMIRSVPKEPSPPDLPLAALPVRPEAPVSPAHEGGCPACALHREAAEARGLINGLAEKSAGQAAIPRALGGTVPLAKLSYERVELLATSIAALRPDLGARCAALAGSAHALAAELSTTVVPAQVGGLSARADGLWRQTHDLTAAYFGEPPPQATLDSWLAWVKAEQPDNDAATARLRDLLSQDTEAAVTGATTPAPRPAVTPVAGTTPAPDEATAGGT